MKYYYVVYSTNMTLEKRTSPPKDQTWFPAILGDDGEPEDARWVDIVDGKPQINRSKRRDIRKEDKDRNDEQKNRVNKRLKAFADTKKDLVELVDAPDADLEDVKRAVKKLARAVNRIIKHLE